MASPYFSTSVPIWSTSDERALVLPNYGVPVPEVAFRNAVGRNPCPPGFARRI